MEVFKKSLKVVLIQIPSANSQLHASLRFLSKRQDHTRLANNITLIKSNQPYNPNKTVLSTYNSTNNHNDKKPIDSNKKPIVLLYGWLLSQDKFLNKFSNIYNDHGFDVLRVKVKVAEVLWPKSVSESVMTIKQFMLSNLDRPYLVHGFSVGGFVHTELIQALLKCPQQQSKQALSLIKAQTFDSVVDMCGVAEGVSASLYINQPIRQQVTKSIIQSYLNLTRKQVMDRYTIDSEIFHSNPLRVPSLMFYSKADTIGTPAPIEAAIQQWRSKGVTVTQKCWDDTEHVGHYKVNPVEYTSYINNFLISLGFIQAYERKPTEVVLRHGGLNAGLKDSDDCLPNRFKTDINKEEGHDDGKMIEVLVEVADDDLKKETRMTAENK